ncbi:hypothetical protein KAI87_10105, partial [Myxococcota bacterium]|nr:hypothetical protein [Myxococcota bacterium]
AKFSPESNEAVADLARSLNGFNKKSIGAVDDFIEQLPNNSRLSRGLKREISTISSMRMGVEIEREGFADTSKGKLDDVLIYLRDPSARTNLNSKQKAMLDQAWSQWQSNPDNAKRLTSEVLASLEIPKTSTYNTLSEDAHKELAEHLDATKAAIADISQIDTTPGADEAKKAAIGEQMAGVLGVPGDIGKWKTDPKVQKLLESMPDDGRKTITDLYEARDTHAMRSDNNYNQLMGLLNSGLPMEAIIMAVMLLLTENEEDKYKLKMRELGGSELVNKLNKDLESNLRATSASPAEAMKAFQEQKIEPADLGLSAKSTTILMQEMQASMQIFSQMLQMLSGVMRQLQEMTMTPIRNIR